MQTDKLVSIIMPVFNGSKTISEAINSLLFQTYVNWECIIVNDGSTDGTKNILDKITDSRFIVVNLPQNMGRPYARQIGLNKAKGKYMAMLDADDFYHPFKLEIQVSIMEANPNVALVSSGMYSFGYNSTLECIRCSGSNEIIHYKKGLASPVAHAPSMLRLSIAKGFRYNLHLKLAQDVDFLSRYLDGRTYIITKDVLYYYSEFDSVSIIKILRGYYYSIVKSCKSFRLSPLFFSYYIAVNVVKIVYGMLIYPFLGINKVLLKRGILPSEAEHEFFIELKNNLSKK